MSAEATAEVESVVEQEPRTWSRLAIATFILSLASPLAIVHSVFWPMVFLLLIFAIASVWLVCSQAPLVRGGLFSILAMCFCLFFLSMAIARYASNQKHLSSEARAFADRWLQLVKEGKLNEAHQFSLLPDLREPPEIPLEDAYEFNALARNNRDSFFLQMPIKFLANDPENCTFRFVQFVGRDTDENFESIRMRYALRYLDLGTPREMNFTIFVSRYRNPRFEDHRWMVRSVGPADLK
jgi:hypothetical protein